MHSCFAANRQIATVVSRRSGDDRAVGQLCLLPPFLLPRLAAGQIEKVMCLSLSLARACSANSIKDVVLLTEGIGSDRAS